MLRPPPNRQSGNRVVYHPARLYLMAMQHYHLFKTRLGLCGIAWSDDGITRFRLPDPDLAAAEKALGARGTPQEPPPHIATAVEEASTTSAARASTSAGSGSILPASIRSALDLRRAARGRVGRDRDVW